MSHADHSRNDAPQAFDTGAFIELRRRCDLSFPYAVRAAVTLHIPELLADGRATTAELAERTGTVAWALGKMLARLRTEGLLEYSLDDSAWSITATGRILTLEPVRGALDERSGHAHLDRAWPGLLHTLRTGESGFEHTVGHTFWESVSADSGLGESFDMGLSRWAGQWSTNLAAVIGAEFAGHVVDVGGGIGRVLADALEVFPSATGTLVELPTTAARARTLLAELGLAQRASFVEQSFFEPLPTGGDVYLLTQVLHDWPDREALRILQRLADVVGPGRVLVVERIHDDAPTAELAAFDLMMNVVFGGGERSLAEYERLAATVGLELAANTPIGTDVTVMELRTSGTP